MIDHRARILLEALPYERQLRAYIKHHTRSPPDTEDLLQELYARLLHQGECETMVVRSMRTFAFTVAQNLLVDWARKQRPDVSLEHLTDAEQLEAALMTWDVEDDVDAEQELELLAQALAHAPKRSREVFTLKKVYGYSQAEIACELNIKINTVQRHVGIAARQCGTFLCNHPGAPRRFSLLERFRGIRKRAAQS